jgi:hypothetical protein
LALNSRGSRFRLISLLTPQSPTDACILGRQLSANSGQQIRPVCVLFTNIIADCSFGRKDIAAALTDDRVGDNFSITGDDDRSRFLTSRKATRIDRIANYFAIGNDSTVAVGGVYPDCRLVVENIDYQVLAGRFLKLGS